MLQVYHAEITRTDISQDPQENIAVWIARRPNSKMRMFFCMVCRTGLLKYKGNIVSVIPGDPEAVEEDDIPGEPITNFPFILKCHGKSLKYGSCPATYIFQGYVEVGI